MDDRFCKKKTTQEEAISLCQLCVSMEIMELLVKQSLIIGLGQTKKLLYYSGCSLAPGNSRCDLLAVSQSACHPIPVIKE